MPRPTSQSGRLLKAVTSQLSTTRVLRRFVARLRRARLPTSIARCSMCRLVFTVSRGWPVRAPVRSSSPRSFRRRRCTTDSDRAGGNPLAVGHVLVSSTKRITSVRSRRFPLRPYFHSRTGRLSTTRRARRSSDTVPFSVALRDRSLAAHPRRRRRGIAMCEVSPVQLTGTRTRRSPSGHR